MTTKKRTQRRSRPVSLLLAKAREFGAAEFKARCLELISEVERLGTEIVITRHRKPVARLVPAQSKGTGFVGCLEGVVTMEGDIVSPTDIVWEADESNFA